MAVYAEARSWFGEGGGGLDLAATPREFPQFGRSVWNVMRTRSEVFGADSASGHSASVPLEASCGEPPIQTGSAGFIRSKRGSCGCESPDVHCASCAGPGHRLRSVFAHKASAPLASNSHGREFSPENAFSSGLTLVAYAGVGRDAGRFGDSQLAVLGAQRLHQTEEGPEWPLLAVVPPDTCEEKSRQAKAGRGNVCNGGTCDQVEGKKCVCAARWKLLPKGKVAGRPKTTLNPIHDDIPIIDVPPGEEPSNHPKFSAIDALNTFVDSKAGCRCLCYDPIRDPDPTDPGGPAYKGRLPGKKDKDGKPQDVKLFGSEWSWDVYQTPAELRRR